MAATIHSIQCLDKAESFSVNGWRPFIGCEPEDFVRQAHAVASLITTSAAEAGGFDKLVINPVILGESLEAIETLLGLGLLAANNRDRESEQRRAA